jgi:hypothetical protein
MTWRMPFEETAQKNGTDNESIDGISQRSVLVEERYFLRAPEIWWFAPLFD